MSGIQTVYRSERDAPPLLIKAKIPGPSVSGQHVQSPAARFAANSP
jgi:hypothetical protein